MQTLKEIPATTLYRKIIYHRTEQIELALYALIEALFEAPNSPVGVLSESRLPSENGQKTEN